MHDASWFLVLTPRKRKRKTNMANFSIRAFRFLKPTFLVLITTLLWNTLAMSPASSQTAQVQPNTRKLKVSVPPEYPELARKMNIQGVARRGTSERLQRADHDLPAL